MEIEKAIGRLQMNNGSLKSLLSNDETDRGLLEKIEANNLAIQALEKTKYFQNCKDCNCYYIGVEGECEKFGVEVDGDCDGCTFYED